jgi:hypothetical protein
VSSYCTIYTSYGNISNQKDLLRLDFFSQVPKEEQVRLERTISVKAWKGL